MQFVKLIVKLVLPLLMSVVPLVDLIISKNQMLLMLMNVQYVIQAVLDAPMVLSTLIVLLVIQPPQLVLDHHL